MGEEVTVREGRATLYFASKKGVFYNPPQIPNRDLSVLALQQFAQMWEAEPAKKKTPPGRSLRQGGASKDGEVPACGAVSAVEGAEAASRESCVQGSGEKGGARQAEEREHGGKGVVDKEGGKGKEGEGSGARRGLRVLDALSASGLRALRYSLEVPGLREVVANDVDPCAVATMRSNFEKNGVADAIISHVGDATALLYASRPPASERFDVVDLDPYGTAAPFLDAAVQAVSEGGMLMVTCTDMAVLAGTYPEACFAKYGAYPQKGKHCHEQALRILLACIDGHAARHGRYITPLLSMHINFYVRIFVRVYSGKSAVKLSPTKVSYMYQCAGCDTFTLQPVARVVDRGNLEKVTAGAGPPVPQNCEHCGQVHHVGGPIWSAPIHDTEFVAALLRRLQEPGAEHAYGAHKRLVGMLTLCAEELPDVPLFLNLSQMCSTLHLPIPQLLPVHSAIRRAGYRVSRSHTDPMAIKTDAPRRALWDVLRCWAKQPECIEQTSKRKTELSPTSPAAAILGVEPSLQADFRPLPEIQQLLARKDASGSKVGKFFPNPTDWGPGSRGTSHANFEVAPDEAAGVESAALAPGKRELNQGKRSKKRATQRDGVDEEGKERGSKRTAKSDRDGIVDADQAPAT